MPTGRGVAGRTKKQVFAVTVLHPASYGTQRIRVSSFLPYAVRKGDFFMKKNSSKAKIAVFGNLKTLVICSLFVAISIVCGKYLAIRGGDILRFSFENLPIILAGIAFGPLAGAVVGVVADLLGCLLVGYAINPIYSIPLFELMLWRLLNYVIVGVLEGVIICIMLKNKTLRAQLLIKKEKRSDTDELH